MGLQNLAEVHTARHTKRVQDDINRGAVFHEWHVFNRNDFGNNAFVTMPAGHFVAHGDFADNGDGNLDGSDDARGELVALLARRATSSPLASSDPSRFPSPLSAKSPWATKWPAGMVTKALFPKSFRLKTCHSWKTAPRLISP